MLKLVIFGSGRGSNFEAIHNSIVKKEVDAEILCVITNNEDAKIIQGAKEREIPVVVCKTEVEILTELEKYDYDIIVLAGYMKIISSEFISEIENQNKKILNIHPSLLPSFKGLNAQQQALEYGVKFAGCTVHVVTPEVDAGKILGQAIVSVSDDDSVDSLSKRILVEEHKLYPAIIQQIARNEIKL